MRALRYTGSWCVLYRDPRRIRLSALEPTRFIEASTLHPTFFFFLLWGQRVWVRRATHPLPPRFFWASRRFACFERAATLAPASFFLGRVLHNAVATSEPGEAHRLSPTRQNTFEKREAVAITWIRRPMRRRGWGSAAPSFSRAA